MTAPPSMPPRCAKWATLSCLPVTPSHSSRPPYKVTSSHGGNGNRNRQDQHAVTWEKPPVCQQYAEHSAGGADDRLDRVRLAQHQQLGARPGQYADEVIQHVKSSGSLAAPIHLHRAAKHVQREHIEDDVHEVGGAVQEGISDELPRMKEWCRWARVQTGRSSDRQPGTPEGIRRHWQ